MGRINFVIGKNSGLMLKKEKKKKRRKKKRRKKRKRKNRGHQFSGL